jgi:hypothetical protein
MMYGLAATVHDVHSGLGVNGEYWISGVSFEGDCDQR